jgi:hypothetical protein
VNVPQSAQASIRKMTRVLRPYRYQFVAKEDRESLRLVRERVKCGKPPCRCTENVSHRHGPYWYLRWEQFDRETGETRYRREYVPAVELARVRQWVSRARTADARGRAILGYLRRSVRGALYRERRRARLGASQRT